MKTFDTSEFDNRRHIHDRLVSIAYGHGYGTEQPLTDDGKAACLRIAQMVLRGTSHFTPQELGKPLGWDYERSMRVIEEITNTLAHQRITLSEGARVYTCEHVLNTVRSSLHGTSGKDRLTYFICGLCSIDEIWGWPDGEL